LSSPPFLCFILVSFCFKPRRIPFRRIQDHRPSPSSSQPTPPLPRCGLHVFRRAWNFCLPSPSLHACLIEINNFLFVERDLDVGLVPLSFFSRALKSFLFLKFNATSQWVFPPSFFFIFHLFKPYGMMKRWLSLFLPSGALLSPSSRFPPNLEVPPRSIEESTTVFFSST